VDAETRFELAFEYALGDVRRTVLVYGFDAPGADLKELIRRPTTVSQGMQMRETYLEPSALAEFPHVLFLVIPNETSRARHKSQSVDCLDARNRSHLRAKRGDLPQEVSHFDGLAARNLCTSPEKITVDNRVPAEPAPGNFPESLLVVGGVCHWSLDDGATRPE